VKSIARATARAAAGGLRPSPYGAELARVVIGRATSFARRARKRVLVRRVARPRGKSGARRRRGTVPYKGGSWAPHGDPQQEQEAVVNRTGMVVSSRATIVVAAVVLVGCAPRPSTIPTPAYASAAHASDERATVANGERYVEARYARLEDRLRGLPGVHIVGSGSNVRVTVRGPGLRSGEPLFVVDGVELPRGRGVAFTLVTPERIKRVEILRDQVSTAVWGDRGSNGVIVITTHPVR
jgi:TonB-dependent SusC/RagA subfamily outer membrane receptor